jgi:hypothetical protein
MKKLCFLFPVVFALSCKQNISNNGNEKLNTLAEKYVRLGLAIGQYDNSFVDAYYGPDSLQPKTTKAAVFPKDSLLASVDRLLADMKTFIAEEKNDTLI